ncbi:MAG: UDP-glucose 4-epimerase GalE, partial [Candidatus Omnitrophica bacterium]|nr:UDP-glucose 4-epimerase GalE [Candidatus Omnitrophota bacterium]
YFSACGFDRIMELTGTVNIVRAPQLFVELREQNITTEVVVWKSREAVLGYGEGFRWLTWFILDNYGGEQVSGNVVVKYVDPKFKSLQMVAYSYGAFLGLPQPINKLLIRAVRGQGITPLKEAEMRRVKNELLKRFPREASSPLMAISKWPIANSSSGHKPQAISHRPLTASSSPTFKHFKGELEAYTHITADIFMERFLPDINTSSNFNGRLEDLERMQAALRDINRVMETPSLHPLYANGDKTNSWLHYGLCTKARWQELLIGSCDISTHYVTAPILKAYGLEFVTRSVLFEPSKACRMQTTAIVNIAGVPFILCLTAFLFEDIEARDIGIVMLPLEKVDQRLFFYDASGGISIERRVKDGIETNSESGIASFVEPYVRMDSARIYYGAERVASIGAPFMYRRAFSRGPRGEDIETVNVDFGMVTNTAFSIALGVNHVYPRRWIEIPSRDDFTERFKRLSVSMPQGNYVIVNGDKQYIVQEGGVISSPTSEESRETPASSPIRTSAAEKRVRQNSRVSSALVPGKHQLISQGGISRLLRNNRVLRQLSVVRGSFIRGPPHGKARSRNNNRSNASSPLLETSSQSASSPIYTGLLIGDAMVMPSLRRGVLKFAIIAPVGRATEIIAAGLKDALINDFLRHTTGFVLTGGPLSRIFKLLALNHLRDMLEGRVVSRINLISASYPEDEVSSSAITENKVAQGLWFDRLTIGLEQTKSVEGLSWGRLPTIGAPATFVEYKAGIGSSISTMHQENVLNRLRPGSQEFTSSVAGGVSSLAAAGLMSSSPTLPLADIPSKVFESLISGEGALYALGLAIGVAFIVGLLGGETPREELLKAIRQLHREASKETILESLYSRLDVLSDLLETEAGKEKLIQQLLPLELAARRGRQPGNAVSALESLLERYRDVITQPVKIRIAGLSKALAEKAQAQVSSAASSSPLMAISKWPIANSSSGHKPQAISHMPLTASSSPLYLVTNEALRNIGLAIESRCPHPRSLSARATQIKVTFEPRSRFVRVEFSEQTRIVVYSDGRAFSRVTYDTYNHTTYEQPLIPTAFKNLMTELVAIAGQLPELDNLLARFLKDASTSRIKYIEIFGAGPEFFPYGRGGYIELYDPQGARYDVRSDGTIHKNGKPVLPQEDHTQLKYLLKRMSQVAQIPSAQKILLQKYPDMLTVWETIVRIRRYMRAVEVSCIENLPEVNSFEGTVTFKTPEGPIRFDSRSGEISLPSFLSRLSTKSQWRSLHKLVYAAGRFDSRILSLWKETLRQRRIIVRAGFSGPQAIPVFYAKTSVELSAPNGKRFTANADGKIQIREDAQTRPATAKEVEYAGRIIMKAEPLRPGIVEFWQKILTERARLEELGFEYAEGVPSGSHDGIVVHQPSQPRQVLEDSGIVWCAGAVFSREADNTILQAAVALLRLNNKNVSREFLTRLPEIPAKPQRGTAEWVLLNICVALLRLDNEELSLRFLAAYDRRVAIQAKGLPGPEFIPTLQQGVHGKELSGFTRSGGKFTVSRRGTVRINGALPVQDTLTAEVAWTDRIVTLSAGLEGADIRVSQFWKKAKEFRSRAQRFRFVNPDTVPHRVHGEEVSMTSGVTSQHFCIQDEVTIPLNGREYCVNSQGKLVCMLEVQPMLPYPRFLARAEQEIPQDLFKAMDEVMRRAGMFDPSFRVFWTKVKQERSQRVYACISCIEKALATPDPKSVPPTYEALRTLEALGIASKKIIATLIKAAHHREFDRISPRHREGYIDVLLSLGAGLSEVEVCLRELLTEPNDAVGMAALRALVEKLEQPYSQATLRVLHIAANDRNPKVCQLCKAALARQYRSSQVSLVNPLATSSPLMAISKWPMANSSLGHTPEVITAYLSNYLSKELSWPKFRNSLPFVQRVSLPKQAQYFSLIEKYALIKAANQKIIFDPISPRPDIAKNITIFQKFILSNLLEKLPLDLVQRKRVRRIFARIINAATQLQLKQDISLGVFSVRVLPGLGSNASIGKGFVSLGQELIEKLEDEALAIVIGHEVAHLLLGLQPYTNVSAVDHLYEYMADFIGLQLARLAGFEITSHTVVQFCSILNPEAAPTHPSSMSRSKLLEAARAFDTGDDSQQKIRSSIVSAIEIYNRKKVSLLLSALILEAMQKDAAAASPVIASGHPILAPPLAANLIKNIEKYVAAAKTVLITGGAGNIGSAICRLLLRCGFSVVAVDDLSAGHRKALPKDNTHFKFYQADIADKETITEIIRRHEIASVIHCAAYIEVGESVNDPLKYYDNNTLSTIRLVNACGKTGLVKYFIFSGTAAAFGDPAEVPIKRDAVRFAINPYGNTKVLGEKIIKELCGRYGMHFVIFNYFNIVGADPTAQFGEDHGVFEINGKRAPTAKESHLAAIANLVLLGRHALPVLKMYGTADAEKKTDDGTGVRDYIDLVRLAEAHLLGLRRLIDTGRDEYFNLSSGYNVSVLSMMQLIEEVTGLKIPSVEAPWREGDPARLYADPVQAVEVLGWQPNNPASDEIDYRQYLRRFLSFSLWHYPGWYLKHPRQTYFIIRWLLGTSFYKRRYSQDP